MQRRFFLLLGLLLAMPAFAQASLISMQGTGQLLPNTPGQIITLLISGSDTYTDSNLRSSINGGVGGAPAVSAVFGDSALTIPGANLAGSVWVNGLAGIASNPNGTTSDSSGLLVIAGFATPGFSPINTAGIYATLTVSTVGVAPGVYSFSLAGTDLFNGLNEDFEGIPVELQFAPMSLSIVPEPSSVVLGLFAAAGMAAVVIRRRRNA
jgi:hypothetical protein